MSALLTVQCTNADCHGVYASKGYDAAALEAWQNEHDAACPVPEPAPLAKLRGELLDLEECDDPDYDDWEHRVTTDLMPIATTAAHHLAAEARADLAALLAEVEPLVGEAGAFQVYADEDPAGAFARATIEMADLERIQELVARLRGTS